MNGAGKAALPKLDLAAYAVFTLAALAYVWAYRFLPLQDYPDWIYQGRLFSQALEGRLPEAYRLLHYPVPNSASTLFMGAFNLFLPPLVSGQLFLSLAVLLFLAGSLYLLNARGNGTESPLGYVPFLFVLGSPFFNGTISYLFGLGVLFLGYGYVLRAQGEGKKAGVPAIALISTALFFSHALSYLAFLLFILLSVPFKKEARAGARYAAGLAPSLLLAAWYAAARLSSALPAGGEGRALFDLVLNARAFASYFSLFRSFYPFTDASDHLVRIAGLLNLVFLPALAALLLAALRELFRRRKEEAPLLAAVALFFAAALFGPRFFAGIVSPGERLLYPAAWLLLAFFVPRSLEMRERDRAGLKLLAFLFFALQAAFLHHYAGYASRQLEGIYRETGTSRAGADLAVISEEGFDFEGGLTRSYRRPPFLPQHSPLARFHCYAAMDRGAAVPVFSTGMLRGGREFRLPGAASALKAAKGIPGDIVVIGHERGILFIASLFPPGYDTVVLQKYCIVIKRRI